MLEVIVVLYFPHSLCYPSMYHRDRGGRPGPGSSDVCGSGYFEDKRVVGLSGPGCNPFLVLEMGCPSEQVGSLCLRGSEHTARKGQDFGLPCMGRYHLTMSGSLCVSFVDVR